MPVLAHDDVVVHGNPKRARDGDDLPGHLDVGARRRGVARGVFVFTFAAKLLPSLAHVPTGQIPLYAPRFCRCVICSE
jgi:hypothetical protein